MRDIDWSKCIEWIALAIVVFILIVGVLRTFQYPQLILQF